MTPTKALSVLLTRHRPFTTEAPGLQVLYWEIQTDSPPTTAVLLAAFETMTTGDIEMGCV